MKHSERRAWSREDSRRALAFVALALVGGVTFGVGCGPAAVGAPAVVPASSASAGPAALGTRDHSGFFDRPAGAYTSARLGFTLSLPDRAGWTIVDDDDANGGSLVAVHAGAQATLRMSRSRESSLVGRRECALRAELVGALPHGEHDATHFETLAREAVHRPLGWDGERWIALEPLATGGMRGHVTLAAGRERVCVILHVTTDVDTDADAEVLADRLELISSRVVGALTADRLRGPTMPTPAPP